MKERTNKQTNKQTNRFYSKQTIKPGKIPGGSFSGFILTNKLKTNKQGHVSNFPHPRVNKT